MAGHFLSRIDDLIGRFIDGNEACRSSPVRFVFTDAGDLDAERFLNAASLSAPKVSVTHPVVDGINASVSLGQFTVERNGKRASAFPHVVAAGVAPDVAVQHLLDLCTESGKLYTQLPSDIFPQGPTNSVRNMWVARVYGKFRDNASVCLEARNYEYIPLPFLACAELWKCFRESLVRVPAMVEPVGGATSHAFLAELGVAEWGKIRGGGRASARKWLNELLAEGRAVKINQKKWKVVASALEPHEMKAYSATVDGRGSRNAAIISKKKG